MNHIMMLGMKSGSDGQNMLMSLGEFALWTRFYQEGLLLRMRPSAPYLSDSRCRSCKSTGKSGWVWGHVIVAKDQPDGSAATDCSPHVCQHVWWICAWTVNVPPNPEAERVYQPEVCRETLVCGVRVIVVKRFRDISALEVDLWCQHQPSVMEGCWAVPLLKF